MKNIRENMPLITVLLVIFGFSNLQVYYEYFNINLINYISVTEILLSFLPFVDSAVKVLLVILILVITAGIEALRNKSEDELKWEQISEAAGSTWWSDIKELFSRKTYSAKWYKVVVNVFFLLVGVVMKSAMFIMFLAGVVVPIYLISTNNPVYFQNFGTLAFLWGLGVFYLSVQNEKVLSKKLNSLGNRLLSKYNMPLTLIFIVLSLSILHQYKRGMQVSHCVEEEKVAFTYQNKVIRSAKDTIFIGRTQSVLFLRQPSTKKILVFPVDDITNLEITEADSIP